MKKNGRPLVEGPFKKGGQNPPNTSSQRPPPPKGSKTESKLKDRNIERLLKDLDWRELPAVQQASEEYHRLDKAADEPRNRLLSGGDVQQADDAAASTRDRWNELREKHQERVRQVRRRYWAEGATDRVRAAIAALLDELEAADADAKEEA